ncbi:MAG TPA: VOC family protein [Myxococcales bacterium]|nr:VOC family protein [Myxococcales bacterium]
MKPTPQGWPRISAAVYYEDPAKAIDFLAKAFGFEVQVKHEENGVVVHSQLVLPGGLVMVGGTVSAGDPDQKWRRSPKQLGGANTQALFIYVDDADAHCKQARAAGAKIVREPTTVDYGKDWWSDRGYEAEDPEGHHWHFAHRVR